MLFFRWLLEGEFAVSTFSRFGFESFHLHLDDRGNSDMTSRVKDALISKMQNKETIGDATNTEEIYLQVKPSKLQEGPPGPFSRKESSGSWATLPNHPT